MMENTEHFLLREKRDAGGKKNTEQSAPRFRDCCAAAHVQVHPPNISLSE